MKIWMYVDEYSTGVDAEIHGSVEAAVASEYDEIESRIRDALPDKELSFSRSKSILDLRNGNPDVYVWDIGGLACVDWSGERRIDMSKQLLQQVEDHPNTLFVPWTSMTRGYLRSALQMLLPEWDDEDAALPTDPPAAPNVWIASSAVDLSFEGSEDSFRERLQEWAKSCTP